MKNRAFLAAVLVISGAHAEEKLPDGKSPVREPESVARPVSNETVSTAEKTKTGAAPRQFSPRDAADTLSEEELKRVVEMLRDTYLQPEALSDVSLDRARVQGLLDRLGAGARIFSGATVANQQTSPFRSQFLPGNVGYLRLGVLTIENLAALDGALEAFKVKQPVAVVLDLRATPHSTDFGLAAECCRRFSPKGRILFSIKKPKANDEEVLTSGEDPRWRGTLVVLVDGDTAGAGEVVAAVLRTHIRAYVIGQRTKGEAAQFEELPLAEGKVLRVATGEVTLPDATPVFPGGLLPDLAVNVTQEKTDEILQLAMGTPGVAPFVTEKPRARMNEAALVAGTNPELDDLLEIQRLKAKGEAPVKPPCDVVLQRALDYITSVGIYEARESIPAGK